MLMGLGVSFIIFFLSFFIFFFIFFYLFLFFAYFFLFFFIFFLFLGSHWHSTPLWNIIFFLFSVSFGISMGHNWHSIPLLKYTMGHNWHSIPLWNILWVTTGTLMKYLQGSQLLAFNTLMTYYVMLVWGLLVLGSPWVTTFMLWSP